MKKIHSILFLIVCMLNASGQQIIFEENFDSHTAPVMIADILGDPWTTVNDSAGFAEDAVISNEESVSASNSMKIEGPAPGVGPDYLFLKLKNNIKGKFIIEMKVFIPSGFGSIIVFHRSESNRNLANTSFFIGFRGNGTGAIVKENLALAKNITIQNDVWFDLRAEFDLDNYEANLYFDDQLKYTQIEESCGELGGIGFVSETGSAGTASKMYVDDVVITDVSPTSINELSPSNLKVYPNPVSSVLHISEVKSDQDAGIIDLTGKVLAQFKIYRGDNEFDLSELPEGMFVLKMGNQQTRLVIRR